MAVAVHFPDGSVRDVPGQLRSVDMADTARTSQIFEQVPLNCDSRWRYERHGRTWHAVSRLGHVALFQPPVPDWWATIAQMIAPTEESGPVPTARLTGRSAA